MDSFLKALVFCLLVQVAAACAYESKTELSQQVAAEQCFDRGDYMCSYILNEKLISMGRGNGANDFDRLLYNQARTSLILSQMDVYEFDKEFKVNLTSKAGSYLSQIDYTPSVLMVSLLCISADNLLQLGEPVRAISILEYIDIYMNHELFPLDGDIYGDEEIADVKRYVEYIRRTAYP